MARIAGPVRTVLLALGSAATAFAVVGLGLALFTRLGEAFASLASIDSLWAPFAGAAGVLVVAARKFAAPWDRLVPVLVLTAAFSMVLFRGHASDAVVLVGVGAAAASGGWVVPRNPRSSWQDVDADRARVTAAALLVGLGIGLAVGGGRDAHGVASPVVYALGPVATPIAVILLLVASAAVLRGRWLGLVVAVVVLAVIIAAIVWRLTVDSVRERWFTWADVPFGDVEWQLSILLLWLIPLAALVVLVRRRQAFVRRSAAPVLQAEHERLVDALQRGDAGSLGWMGTWDGTSTWFSDDGKSAVAYRACNGVALTVSDPICSPEDAAETIKGFARECSRLALVPAFYSVHAAHEGIFAELGWTVTQVAEESVLDLATFSLKGKKRTDLRTAVNRAARVGVTAEWTSFSNLNPAMRRQVVALSQGWVSQKELPEMGFTLGGLPEMDDPAVRLLVAVDTTGQLHGVTSWLPVYRRGQLVGLTLDVMRRGRSAMPGTIEFLIVHAALDSAAEGLESLSLSGTPLARSGQAVEPMSGPRGLAGRGRDVLGRLLEPAYGFASLARFKGKFQPEHRPLLVACPTALELPVVGRALVSAYVPSLKFRQVLALVSQVRHAGQERRRIARLEKRGTAAAFVDSSV
ncbi:DUF2156 domain-containing protein [Curtobacterium sp. MCSS17_016]|uniref:bifunctional lysylphosphatidylglycerol flippase/synthetase MprF n=1 Tax=Curtobacterium sp. MCSS17_016 TaxID=2175644 RepID=UPI0015E8ABEE|nr:DUF2156 domain-containing protein [Curtobacterium sp. MCSS17_016]WIE79173.1 DUF2156 domain-containing protein [Curtobacterium sp. MCSS17_016]